MFFKIAIVLISNKIIKISPHEYLKNIVSYYILKLVYYDIFEMSEYTRFLIVLHGANLFSEPSGSFDFSFI